MRMNKIILIIIAVLLIIMAFTGCGQSEPTQEFQVPPYSENITEILLLAFSIGEYNAYLSNFDPAGDKAMSEDWFTQNAVFNQSKIGVYIAGSKQVYEVQQKEGFTDVIYKTKFTDEPADVYVTVAFSVTENRTYAAGIWFNSPKLFGQ